MITIQFDFKHRRAEDLAQLNALLAVMQLRDLQLEDADGYLETTSDGDGNLLHRRYGLDSGKLICTLANGSAGYCYQIDSLVVDRSVDHDTCLQLWRENHSDRTMRIVIQVEYENVSGYLIVHHQRI